MWRKVSLGTVSWGKTAVLLDFVPPPAPILDKLYNFFEHQKRRFKQHLKWLIIKNLDKIQKNTFFFRETFPKLHWSSPAPVAVADTSEEG